MYCGDAVDTRGRDSSGGGIYRLPVGGPALVQGSILVSTARQRVDFVFSIRIQVLLFFWGFFYLLLLFFFVCLLYIVEPHLDFCTVVSILTKTGVLSPLGDIVGMGGFKMRKPSKTGT